MSSSNPFRRSILTDRLESSAALTSTGAPPHPDLELPSRPTSISKKVRISSPPRSPSPTSSPHPLRPVESDNRGPRRGQSHYDGPPFPDLQSQSGQVVVSGPDPFEPPSSSEDEAQSTDTEQMPESVNSIRRTPGMPPNPFSRTLATIEEPWRLSGQQEQLSGPAESSQTDRRMPRASMDVDAFKNLLMTGKATSSVPPAISRPKPPSLTTADNSSSTDTSSVSRQSLSEPMLEVASETPRTSYEQSISEEEDDGTKLLKEKRRPERTKPPPPRHRHGKAVVPKGPQIVSFADFTPSISPASPPSVPITVSSASPTSPTRTDLNKPLPPPPRPSSRDSASIDKEITSPRRSLDAASEVSEATTTRRIPPTIPLARRSSRHSNTPSMRSRSNTQTSSTSLREDIESAYEGSIAESTTSSLKAAPAPPPKRRSNIITIPQTYSPDDESASLNLSRTSSLKSPPPLPPQRNRSLSQLSSPSAVSASSGTMSPPPPPPPPPPRRSVIRQSSRGSIDLASPLGSRRVSQEVPRLSLDSDRRGSLGSILKENAITEEPGRYEVEASRVPPLPIADQPVQSAEKTQEAKDILADMEAFQREIDELKRKFEEGR